MELMAEALDVPPETFLEYQVFQITEALEAHPEICPYVYRTVLGRARIMDELQASDRGGIPMRGLPIIDDEEPVGGDTKPNL